MDWTGMACMVSVHLFKIALAKMFRADDLKAGSSTYSIHGES